MSGLFTILAAGRAWRAGGPGPKNTLTNLLEMMGNFDGEWYCWPSVETLAKESEQSVSTVQRHLRSFEEIGLIRRDIQARKDGGRAISRIVLNLPMLMEGNEAKSQIDTLASTAEGEPNSQPGGSQIPSDTAECAFGPPSLLLTRTHKNGEGTRKPPTADAVVEKRATDDPVKRRAHELAKIAFEGDEKPDIAVRGKGGVFPAVLSLFDRLLRQGHAVRDLERVARMPATEITWTLAGLQAAVNTSRRKTSVGHEGNIREMEELASREGA